MGRRESTHSRASGCSRVWVEARADAPGSLPRPPRTLRQVAARAGVCRRFAPHQSGHAHAIELAHEGVPRNVIQRQLGHRNLGVTSLYLQGIDPDEIIQTVHARRPPMISASVGLELRRSGSDLPQRNRLSTVPPHS